MQTLWNLVIAVLTLAPLGYLASVYGGLPERIAVHWNLYGVADRFATKSALAVFMPSLLALLTQALLGMMAYDFNEAIALEKGTGEEPELRKQSLALSRNMMEVLRLFIAGLFCMVAMMQTAQAQAPAWTTYFLIAMTAGITLTAIGGAFRLWQLQSKWEASAQSDALELNDNNWRWMRTIYYNGEDPRLWVAKRLGVGFTFNMAHPKVKLYGVVIAAITILPLLLVFTGR